MRHIVHEVIDPELWICWGAFAVVWTVGAVIARRRPSAKGGRDFASLGAAVIALVAIKSPSSLWEFLTTGSTWPRLVGVAMLALATPVALWARLELGTMWSSRTVVKQGHFLRTDGLYGFMRHPIYTALLGMVAGTALAEGLGRWVLIFVGVLLFVSLKIRAEERLLSQEFPDEYARYRRAVPRLLPRPWRHA
jgi:protein-S-isoprenylcysteine O-methyltransferase Ste14